MITDWTNKRVTVIGLGRFGGGVGVTRWLARTGAKVLVTDNQSPEILTTSLEQISDLNVELRLGRHDEADFRDTDLVVVNPAVRDDSPFLQAARAANVPLTTEINLFVERCPARSIGVTGSVGKSTIAAMTEHVLKNILTDRRIWLGGNIGRCLLDDLDTIQAEDLVVLELSSFQLLRTPIVRWSPHIAVITNVTPNHLDWHGAFAAYLAAKLNIIRFQNRRQDAIVFENTPELAHHLSSTLDQHAPRWCYGLDGDELFSDHDGRRLRWKHVELNVPGEHNRRRRRRRSDGGAPAGHRAGGRGPWHDDVHSLAGPATVCRGARWRNLLQRLEINHPRISQHGHECHNPSSSDHPGWL